ncbi:MAG: RluA family pseudouridine synthase, partial [Planctomycetota bacterium]|nr:RluA family pseudouridine synthase [Planctomycetota bacterium]
YRNHPIVGDPVYGNKNQPVEYPLLLAATTLSLLHPRTGNRLTFEIPLPPEIQSAIKEPTNP